MMAAYSIKILDQLFNNFMGKDYFRHAALLIVFCAISAFAFAQPKPSIKPIDPELIAKKFKRGIFKAETIEIGADGKREQESAAMCMDEQSSHMLVFGVLAGVAGCEPLSTREDKSSIAVTANCPTTSEMGANFYSATMRWTADGKRIEMESKRVTLEGGKPTDKLLKSLQYKLTHQAASCP